MNTFAIHARKYTQKGTQNCLLYVDLTGGHSLTLASPRTPLRII